MNNPLYAGGENAAKQTKLERASFKEIYAAAQAASDVSPHSSTSPEDQSIAEAFEAAELTENPAYNPGTGYDRLQNDTAALPMYAAIDYAVNVSTTDDLPEYAAPEAIKSSGTEKNDQTSSDLSETTPEYAVPGPAASSNWKSNSYYRATLLETDLMSLNEGSSSSTDNPPTETMESTVAVEYAVPTARGHDNVTESKPSPVYRNLLEEEPASYSSLAPEALVQEPSSEYSSLARYGMVH